MKLPMKFFTPHPLKFHGINGTAMMSREFGHAQLLWTILDLKHCLSEILLMMLNPGIETTVEYIGEDSVNRGCCTQNSVSLMAIRRSISLEYYQQRLCPHFIHFDKSLGRVLISILHNITVYCLDASLMKL